VYHFSSTPAMKRFYVALVFIFVGHVSIAQQNNTRAIFQKLQYCKIPGVKDSVLCGTCPVIENRETNKGRIINLNIIVVPALHPDSLLAPIFDIEGGPGISDTKNVFFYAAGANPYRQYHDVVLIDVRGTGKSNSLYCPSLQDKKTLSEQLEEMYPAAAVKECYEELSKHADLTQYTTTNVVKDYEDVRKWLGYDTIELFSLSYGTRVAQVYMKLFPLSIEGCVLWSPVTTYARMPLYHAQYAQDVLNKLFEDCMNDPACHEAFPDLQNEFEVLMKRGIEQPFKSSYKDSAGNVQPITISWDAVQTKLRTLLYTPAGLSKIPYIIHQAYLGNFSPFLLLYRGFDVNRILSEGFYLCVTCSEDVPFINDNEIDSATKGTFMGTYRVDVQKRACANWVRGDVPKDFFDTIHTDVPVLIFSGGMDPVTPPAMAREIATHLSNSTLVFIEPMGHTFDGLSHPECFDRIAASFLNNPTHAITDTGCVKEMLPPAYKVK